MKTLLFAMSAACVPSLALAQAAPEPPPRHEGSAEFAYVATTGNTDTTTLGVAGEYLFRPSQWIFQWKTGYIRNEAEDVLSAEAFRFLFRTDRKITPRMSTFGLWNYLHDAFAGTDHRNVLAGGVSYQLVVPGAHELWVDGGIGYTNEQRLTGDDLSTAIALTGFRYKFKLSETAEITDDLGFEFSLSDNDDWRTANILSVTAKLTTLFSLKASYSLRHVGEPAPGFDKTDTITAVALVAKF
jgi:putative salt-induced outer membrane protein YdiY